MARLADALQEEPQERWPPSPRLPRLPLRLAPTLPLLLTPPPRKPTATGNRPPARPPTDQGRRTGQDFHTDLLDAFKEMTLLELSDYVKPFEETFDSPPPP